jgi:hypothetical protein
MQIYFEEELLGIYISLNHVNKGLDWADLPQTLVQIVTILGHGYDLAEVRSADNPKDKVSVIRTYTFDANRKKIYSNNFFPVSKVIGVNVRNWDKWYPIN